MCIRDRYSPVLQIIITVFMILSGVNYVAYFYIMTKQLKEIFKVEEIRVYFGIILGAGTFIALNIRSLYGSLGEAFRHAFFQVGSIITTCGYATTDLSLIHIFQLHLYRLLHQVLLCK